jgi:error-prone DNA polymerase
MSGGSSRSGAVREVGKVMGLSEDVTAGLSRLVWGWSRDGVGEDDRRAGRG